MPLRLFRVETFAPRVYFLKPMEAKGAKFDENFHEAITQIPAPTPEAKGTVFDVVKKGYFLNDEVLRFAQVVVAC